MTLQELVFVLRYRKINFDQILMCESPYLFQNHVIVYYFQNHGTAHSFVYKTAILESSNRCIKKDPMRQWVIVHD